MAKKTLKKKLASKKNPMMGSAKDIWLAGLGAMSLAQQEGGKVIEQGAKLFDKLVKEGSKFENSTRKSAEGAVDGLKEGLENRFSSVRKQAAENWDKLEKVFEDRVSRVLGRLGVPTSEDIQDLVKRVQDLAEKVKDTAVEKTAPKRKTKAKTAKSTASKARSAAAKSAKKVAEEVKAKVA